MAALAVRDEIDAGRRAAVDRDAAHIDALALPQCDEHPSECIVADARDVAGARAEPCGGDCHIGRVAAESLHVRVRLLGANLIEFDERLAERNDVDRRGHRVSARNPAAYAAAAARTAAALAPGL